MDINKEKCKQLKKLRKGMADKLGVDIHQVECTHEGKCAGTCPKCKQEESILNKAILSKGAAVLATAAVTVGLTGCSADLDIHQILENAKNMTQKEQVEDIAGEVEYTPETDSEKETEEIEMLDGEVAYIPDELSGYVDNSTTLETDDIYELSGDVPYIEEETNEFISGNVGNGVVASHNS